MVLPEPDPGGGPGPAAPDAGGGTGPGGEHAAREVRRTLQMPDTDGHPAALRLGPNQCGRYVFVCAPNPTHPTLCTTASDQSAH